MKKRIVPGILSGALLLGLAATPATPAHAAEGAGAYAVATTSADDSTSGDAANQKAINGDVVEKGSCGAKGNEQNVTWKVVKNGGDVDGATYTLTISGTGAMKDYEWNWDQDVLISTTPWKDYAPNITEVKFGDGITNIGNSACLGLTKITSVTIPASVERVGESAFRGDTSLSSVNLPESIKTLDTMSFEDSGLTSIKFPENLEKIGKLAFSETKLTGQVVFPNSLKTIGKMAFYDISSSGISLIFGSGLTEIGDTAFGKTKLTGELKFPESLETIGGSAFWNTESGPTDSVRVTFGHKLKSIGKEAFYISALSGAATFPNSLETIGEAAFKETHDISVTFGTGLHSLGKEAFKRSETYPNAVKVSTGSANGTFVWSDGLKLETNALTGLDIDTLLVEGNHSLDKGQFSNLKYNIKNIVLMDVDKLIFSGGSSATGKIFYNTYPRVLYGSSDSLKNKIDGGNAFDTNTTPDYAITNGGYFTSKEFPIDKLATPVRDGYTFGGWFDEQGNKVSVPSDNVSTGAGGKKNVYHAKWALNAPDTATVSASATHLAPGQSAELTATATHDLGDGVTYSYQWYKGEPDSGSELPDKTEQTLAVSYDELAGAATKYYCVVTAKEGEGMTASATTEPVELSCSTKASSIAVSDDGVVNGKLAATYGDGAVEVAFEATEGIDVTVDSSDKEVAEASIAGGVLTVAVKGAGEATVTLSFGGNGVYSSASASFTVSVAQRELTITPKDKSCYVGDELPALGRDDFTVNGLVAGDVLAKNPTLSYAEGASSKKAGEFDIEAKDAGAGPNYEIEYKPGKLIVSNRPVTPPSTTTTETVTNADGSTTTTVTDKSTGTVTVTRTYKDGVAVKTVKAKDAEPKVSVTVPAAVKSATVTVPVDADEGTVAYDTKAGRAINRCVPTEDGLDVKVTGSCEFVIRENAKAFSDMSGHWVQEAVDFASARGLMNGIGDTGTFEPETMTSRAMVCAVLSNLEYGPAAAGAPTFVDVAPGSWYAKAIAWAAETGIVHGYGEGSTFGPSDDVTREQMACMIYNYARAMGMDTTKRADLSAYKDASELTFGREAMEWCVASGIFHGYDGGEELGGLDGLTRGQCAAVLMNLVTLIVEG